MIQGNVRRLWHTFFERMVTLNLHCIGIRWKSVKLKNCYVVLKMSHCLQMDK